LEPVIRGDFRSHHPQVRIRIEVPLPARDRRWLRMTPRGALRGRVSVGH
jgi:hypothetical protein